PIEGWLGVLDPMLYPPDETRRRSGPAACCPRFGDDSVVERGPEGRPPAHGSVRPGLHCPKADGPGVVWWDPAALPLEVEEQGQLRHQRILQTDAVAAASEEDYSAWKTAREALLGRASCPSMSVRTVTSLARAAAAEASPPEKGAAEEGGRKRTLPDIIVERVERGDRERPHGRRFGAL